MLSLLWRGRAPVSSLLAKFACLLNRHVPYRRRANWDGSAYVSRCRHCGLPIKRAARHKWRRKTDDPRGGDAR